MVRKMIRCVVVLLVFVLATSSEGITIVKRQVHQFLCNDNSRIDLNLVCNGLRDCADGSDETLAQCQRWACQSGYLKCDYGACVNDLAICGTSPSEGCRIDRLPQNGYASLAPDSSARISMNTVVPNYATIRYSCQLHHYIVDKESRTNICLDNKWISKNVPDCQLRCKMEDVSSPTYLTSCFRMVNNKRQEVRCNVNDLVGADVSVQVTCKSGYRSATAIDQQAKCGADGKWNRLINPCVQICGEEGPDGSTYIVGGHVTKNTKVPWHVGIYRATAASGGDLEYTCGGTIINPRVVVSAIHCFWDGINDKVYPASEYRVVAGKFFRRYADPLEKEHFQTVHVNEIHYPDGYIHYDGLFANDVAIVILQTFIEFKPHVAPACIDYHYGFEEKFITPGETGRVAGWGLVDSNGALSNELKTIELPVVGRTDCVDSLDWTVRKFVTHDKYCAGFKDRNVGVCQGDSGGGLLFPKRKDGKNVFYLRGVVSAGPNSQGSCDSNKYAFFTNTAHFTDLIQYFDEQTKPEYVDVDESISSTKPSPKPLRKADRACLEYKRLAPSHPPNNDTYVATLEEFPHMASLSVYGLENDKVGGHDTFDFFCGGLLISEWWILTAAHCTISNRHNAETKVEVDMGRVTYTSDVPAPNYIRIYITEMIRHPNYSRFSLVNNIALLRMSKPLKFTDHVRPACLSTNLADVKSEQEMILIGFGNDRSQLHKASHKVMTFDVCNTKYGGKYTAQQICSIGPSTPHLPCDTTRGGPIGIVGKNNVYTAVGVLSYGAGCGTVVPSTYEHISSFVDWIEPIVWPDT